MLILAHGIHWREGRKAFTVQSGAWGFFVKSILVTYVQPDGSPTTCEIQVGESVMDGALDHGVPGIIGQCGGGCTCATCHCYVRPPFHERLAPPDADERELLEYVWQPRANSRLACRIFPDEGLSGLIVDVPAHQA